MKTTRRQFIRVGAMGVSLSFFAPGGFVPRLFAETPDGDRVLVVLQLAGGNDSVNTFIPYADSRYRSLRPALAIPEAEILKVDSAFGFHPALESLRPLWEQRRFAFVHNVGFPSLDRSHFHCQDVWQSADDSHGQSHGSLGWLGRWADLYLGEEARSVTSLAVGNTIPLGMRGAEVVPAVLRDAESFDVLTNDRFPDEAAHFRTSLRNLYALPEPDPNSEKVRDHGSEMFETIDLVGDLPPSSSDAPYPGSALGEAFRLAAQMIGANLGTRAVWIKVGSFDTHATQLDVHERLLRDVADSLSAFHTDLAGRGASHRVIVMAWSEFGRRVQENASAGTDHGKAGSVFLLGDAIDGGRFYGDPPDLQLLDEGDLRTEIDFRAVYATILRDWFGHDPEPVLFGAYENIGFLRAPFDIPRRRGVRR